MNLFYKCLNCKNIGTDTLFLWSCVTLINETITQTYSLVLLYSELVLNFYFLFKKKNSRASENVFMENFTFRKSELEENDFKIGILANSFHLISKSN